MKWSLVFYGLGLWMIATLILRLAGQRLLHPGDGTGTLVLVRRLCRRYQPRQEEWLAGAVSLLLPTLLLDPPL